MAKIDAKEMLAALGVIGSLLFVGYEIRQNTEAVRGSTIQGIADQSLQVTLALSMDEDWLRLQERIVGDSVPPSQLSPLGFLQGGLKCSMVCPDKDLASLDDVAKASHCPCNS